MITIVDSRRDIIHIADMSYAHTSSLCTLCTKYRFSPKLTIQEIAKEFPAHIFYLYETVVIISLSWREVCILSAIITDELGGPGLYNKHLSDIYEALSAAFELVLEE